MGSTTDTVRIFDTTLRDGEQSPGIALNAGEKVEIARQLERLGVNVIEAGFAISSPGEVEAHPRRRQGGRMRRRIAGAVQRRGHRRRHRVAARRQHAAHPHVHRNVGHPHGAQAAHDAGRGGRGRPRGPSGAPMRFTADVEFSCEDATRTDAAFMALVVRTAIAAGATTINIPDTVGYTVPEEYVEIFTDLYERVPELHGVVLSCTATTTWGWPWPTRWRASWPERGRWSAQSTASASGRATPPSRRS